MFITLYWLQCLFLQVNQYKKIIQKISAHYHISEIKIKEPIASFLNQFLQLD